METKNLTLTPPSQTQGSGCYGARWGFASVPAGMILERLLPPGIRQFILQELARQEERLFLWAPAVLTLGIALYFSLPFEPDWRIVLSAGSVIISALSFLIFHLVSGNSRYFFIFILIFVSGFTAASVRTALVHTPMLEREVGPADIVGRVLAIEALEGESDKRLVLGDLAVEGLAPDLTPRKVRLRLREADGIAVGDRVKALARLMPLSPPPVPGGFDFQQFFYFKGIGAVGFIYKDAKVLESDRSFWDFSGIEALRQVISERIYRAVQGPEGPVIAALINGERSSISEDDDKAMRNSGLAHMLSISGLHVGLVAGIVFFFVRLGLALVPGLALHRPIKKYAAIAAIAAAFVYMLVAGATAPTQRSMLMTGAVFAAILIDRDPFSLRLVSFAAFVVLLLFPESLLSPSFQMSFAAVTALIWFCEETRERWAAMRRKAGWLRRAALYVGGVCVTTVIATLATAPFGAYHFQQFVNYGVLANVLAMPVMGFWVMPMAVLAVLFMTMGLEGLALQAMAAGVWVILEIARAVADLPGSVFLMPAIPFSAFILFVAGALMIVAIKGAFRLLALVPLALAVLAVAGSRAPDILISSDQGLIGYRQEDRLFLSSLRRDKFTAENWQQYLGMPPRTAFDWKDDAALHCDDLGCYARIKARLVAFSLHPRSHAEDCAQADLVIASDPVRIPCNAKVIDRYDSWRHGAHAVTLEEKDIHIEAAGRARGKRPWVVR